MISLYEGFFCDPHKDIKPLEYGEWEQKAIKDCNCQFAFSGMKGVDGYMKRMLLKKYAKNNYTKVWKGKNYGVVYPLALWTNKEVKQYNQSRNLIKNFSYGGDSVSCGIGFTETVFLYLIKYYPDDYKKILNDFPYADKILYDIVK